MAVKVYKPTTNGRRVSSVQDFSDITKTRPEKSLVRMLKKHSGRNNTGKITVRHQGGGVKQMYRVIDFKQDLFDIPGTVQAIEYDPNRGPRIALVEYTNGVKSYILAGEGMKVGDTVVSSLTAVEPKPGVRMPLQHIPVGLFVYNIELTPRTGGKIVRGAGTAAQLQVIEGDYAQLRLPSGEVRMVQKECSATIGRIGNSDFQLVRYGKAGRMRKLGWRPVVRGKVMNPVDHPHGGGEGRNSIGLKGGPKTIWGKKALGIKTRDAKKWSNKLIIQRRKGRKV
ncbi:MAG TPA: 50S ribosomal protein L2 [Candidatus Kapabacteria bacterium]|nr:50S ribosomal protein L2 [Candidatus Kapabacteria bacterium]